MASTHGRKGVPSRWPPSRSVRLHERVLHGILRITRPSADHVRDPDGDGLVRAHQRRVGIHVTLLRAAGEIDVIEWTALHRQILAQVDPTRTRRLDSTRAAMAARPHSPTTARHADTGPGRRRLRGTSRRFGGDRLGTRGRGPLERGAGGQIEGLPPRLEGRRGPEPTTRGAVAVHDGLVRRGVGQRPALRVQVELLLDGAGRGPAVRQPPRDHQLGTQRLLGSRREHRVRLLPEQGGEEPGELHERGEVVVLALHPGDGDRRGHPRPVDRGQVWALRVRHPRDEQHRDDQRKEHTSTHRSRSFLASRCSPRLDVHRSPDEVPC